MKDKAYSVHIRKIEIPFDNGKNSDNSYIGVYESRKITKSTEK